jgi:hypothetical protein
MTKGVSKSLTRSAHAESLAGEAVRFANLEQEIEGRLSRTLG